MKAVSRLYHSTTLYRLSYPLHRLATSRHTAVPLAGWAAWGSNGVSVPASAPHVISDTISGSRVLIFYIFAQQIVTGLCCQVFDWCWQSATTWYGPASITCWRHAVSWSLRRNAGQLVPLHPFQSPPHPHPAFFCFLRDHHVSCITMVRATCFPWASATFDGHSISRLKADGSWRWSKDQNSLYAGWINNFPLSFQPALLCILCVRACVEGAGVRVELRVGTDVAWGAAICRLSTSWSRRLFLVFDRSNPRLLPRDIFVSRFTPVKDGWVQFYFIDWGQGILSLGE